MRVRKRSWLCPRYTSIIANPKDKDQYIYIVNLVGSNNQHLDRVIVRQEIPFEEVEFLKRISLRGDISASTIALR